EIINRVLPRSVGEDESVVPRPARLAVIPSAASQAVIARHAVEDVGARAAVNVVVAAETPKTVPSIRTGDNVVTAENEVKCRRIVTAIDIIAHCSDRQRHATEFVSKGKRRTQVHLNGS